MFLSNCSRPYLDAHRQAFSLEHYFDAFYCIADYPVSDKVQLYQIAASQFPGQHIIIGDRFHDLAVAQHFHLPFIGCQNGYGTAGELELATVTINAVTQLPAAVAQIEQR